MRTGLLVSIALLAATLLLGWWEERENHVLSQRYVSAAEEVQTLCAMQEWGRAETALSAHLEDWADRVPWLQMLINHEDIDDVTLTMEKLKASVQAQDLSACFEACAELKENARHIHHRDAFSLGNIL